MDALDREFNEMCRGVAPAARVVELGREAALIGGVAGLAHLSYYLAAALQLRPASQAHPADIVEAARRDQLQAQEAERRRAAGLPS